MENARNDNGTISPEEVKKLEDAIKQKQIGAVRIYDGALSEDFCNELKICLSLVWTWLEFTITLQINSWDKQEKELIKKIKIKINLIYNFLRFY